MILFNKIATIALRATGEFKKYCTINGAESITSLGKNIKTIVRINGIPPYKLRGLLVILLLMSNKRLN